MADSTTDTDRLLLGNMVASVRRLENGIYAVARATGVLEPEKRTATDALRASRREVMEGLPPWSRDITQEEVLAWIDGAQPILQRRNRHIHWYPMRLWVDDSWKPYRFSLRTKKHEPDENDELADLHRRASQSADTAIGMHAKLLFEVRKGVYHYHPTMMFSFAGTDLNPIIYYQKDSGWPTPPEADELLTWYRELTRTAPPEWATWPMERYQRQQ